MYGYHEDLKIWIDRYNSCVDNNILNTLCGQYVLNKLVLNKLVVGLNTDSLMYL